MLCKKPDSKRRFPAPCSKEEGCRKQGLGVWQDACVRAGLVFDWIVAASDREDRVPLGYIDLDE